MATVIYVKTSSLKSYLSDLDYLFPKGSRETPLGLAVNGNALNISYTNGCIYKASINCQNASGNSEYVTIIYVPITSFLVGEETCLSFEPYGVTITSGGFEFTLHSGFSTVSEVSLPDLHKVQLGSAKIQNIRSLLKLSSSVVAGIEKPIIFRDSCAFSIYPNIIIMTKLDDVKMEGAYSLDNAKLLLKFSPETYAISEPGFVYLQRYNATLKLPMNDVDTELDLNKILKTPLCSVNVYSESLSDTIRRLYKMCGEDIVTLIFKEAGLDISLNSNLGNFKMSLGQDSNVLYSVRMPLNMLTYITDIVENSVRITYYEGSILCFQTTTLTIVIHALH